MRDSLKNKPAILYMARNKITDDFYIGVTSKKLQERQREHLCNMRRGKYNKFYNAIRKYGQKNFIWTKIGGVENYKECLELEIHLIKEMSPKYNISAGGDGNLGLIHSEQARQKMSLARKGKPSSCVGQKRSEECKKKMSEAKKGQPCFWKGKKRSQETKDKIRKSKTGNVPRPSREIIEKLKINGAKHSLKKRKPVICIDDDNEFSSARDAAKFYNLDAGNIGCVCNGKRKSCGSLKFEWSN